jgi:hypothetical protein
MLDEAVHRRQLYDFPLDAFWRIALTPSALFTRSQHTTIEGTRERT